MFSSFLAASLLSLALSAGAFPEYRSLAGLSAAESTPGAQPPPPAINDTSSKLVFDEAHPWEPLRPGDIRGPCPGLNTLASHGYLDRSGVVTPGEIITAVQEGFNMGWDLAAFVTYAAFIVDGNHLTNLMSIGAKTPETGPDARTRYYWRFEHSRRIRGNFLFNETLFDQLSQAAIDFGSNGTLDVTSAAVHRHNRILDSIARNPNFTFVTPRYLTAYAETTFPLAMFVSNQTSDSSMTLGLDDARSFFQKHKYPDNFFRRNGSYGLTEVGVLGAEVFELFPNIFPGNNEGVGNYVLDPEDPGFNGDGLCYAYYKQTNFTLSLYPDPTDDLRTALQQNLASFYSLLGDPTCEEVFPFGQ
ncbi:hypothetical protein BT96DRAFT_967157 [Gymnopus androsaceus JB14]|uniref:Heme haloperoxidase family profile domain-containing protein n=1 Tax=Gymnopus androsaceus JB14 TaxID=1447944 RepID=A0A6A4H659_9AGAR|nr:hypothetical protein BT96DRAFT_967157 [Gymnopus androsaceus JB14]